MLMNNPETKANVIALTRQPLLYTGRSYGIQRTHELQSLANYITLLRATNPTRRVAIVNSAHDAALISNGESNKDRMKMIDKTTANEILKSLTGSVSISNNPDHQKLTRFLSMLGSFHPSRTLQIAADVAMYEEEYAIDRKQASISGGADKVQSEYAMAILRFFRMQSQFTEEAPLNLLLDPLYKDSYYHEALDAHAFLANKISDELSFDLLNMAPFNFKLSSDQQEMNKYVSTLILLDVLHCLPKLDAEFNKDIYDITSKEPEVRYNGMKRLTRLARFISLQPFMMYTKMMYDMLQMEEVKAAVSTVSTSFFETDLYKTFAARITPISFGHVYRHIMSDTTSGPVVTRKGSINVLRIPDGLKGIFGSLQQFRLGTVSTSASNSAKTTILKGADGLLSFQKVMREFIRISDLDETWAEFSEFGSILGYSQPTSVPELDLMNPKIIISDGWSATDPIDYRTATTGIVFNPRLFKSGRPSKIAITNQSNLKLVDIGSETSVTALHNLSGASDVSAEVLNKEGFEHFACQGGVLHLIKRAAYHLNFGGDLRVALQGRLPLFFYNGDPGADMILHTTFDDMAFDLGMSPEALAELVKISLNPSIVDDEDERRLYHVIGKFFKIKGVRPNGSIFTGGQTYGLNPELGFAHSSYFSSARAHVLSVGTFVRLNSMFNGPICLVSREIDNAKSKPLTSFRTIISEPYEALAHDVMFKEASAIGDIISKDWGVEMPKI